MHHASFNPLLIETQIYLFSFQIGSVQLLLRLVDFHLRGRPLPLIDGTLEVSYLLPTRPRKASVVSQPLAYRIDSLKKAPFTSLRSLPPRHTFYHRQQRSVGTPLYHRPLSLAVLLNPPYAQLPLFLPPPLTTDTFFRALDLPPLPDITVEMITLLNPPLRPRDCARSLRLPFLGMEAPFPFFNLATEISSASL